MVGLEAAAVGCFGGRMKREIDTGGYDRSCLRWGERWWGGGAKKGYKAGCMLN